MGQSKPGLRVRATARKAGISAAHVSNVLAGKRRPSLDVAKRIAKACDMSLQALVDLVEQGPKPS